MKEVTVMLELDKWQLKKLDEFAALRRKTEIIPRPENCYTHEATLQYILRIVSFDAIVNEATAWVEELLKNRKESVSEFWEVEPSEDGEAEPEEPEEEPETVSDPEELPHMETLVPFGEPEEPETVSNAEKKKADITFSVAEGNMIHDALCDVGQHALARRFPHTWLFPVRDESLYNALWEGDTLISLDAEECRIIANALFDRSRFYYDAGYETIGDGLSVLAWKINRAAYPVRMANLAASCARSAASIARSADEAGLEEPETLIPIIGADGVRRMATLDEVEAMREAAQGIYEGRTPEPKEPETDSNAEELPAVRRGPLMDDKSDLYFRLLEGRNVG